MLAGALQARGEVHAVADDRVVHPLRAADVAGDDEVGVEADAHVEGGLAALPALAVPLPEAADHRDRGAERPILVVLARHR